MSVNWEGDRAEDHRNKVFLLEEEAEKYKDELNKLSKSQFNYELFHVAELPFVG